MGLHGPAFARDLCRRDRRPGDSHKSNNMQVFIPTPLRSYTIKPSVEAEGRTLGALLADLDRRYPGIHFRMVDEQQQSRRHVRIFVNGLQIFDLAHGLQPADEVCVVQALSGG